MLTPSEIVVSRSKPAERHAAAACDMIPPQDPTPSIMAERFAPGAQRSAGESQPAPRPKGPVPGLIAERTRTPAAGRWLLATSLCVSLVPTAIILALIWQGAIKFPQSGSLPFRFEAEEQAQTQQASLADVPAIAPQRAEAVEVKPEIALSAPTRLEAAPGAAVPFDIAIDSADALPARSVIAVRALPRGATFSQGRPYAETEWNLRPDEIGDLVLKLPESASGSADLRIELMAADGTVLANATTTLAVAPDANAGLILRADEAGRVAGLIAHGEKMIAVGYLAGARAYFKRAAEAGSGEAALKLGATYDPDFIAEIGALGVKADLDQAHAWYERAKQLGVEAPETKLKALREEWNERQESGHAMNEHAAEPDLAAAESAAKAPAGAPVPIDGKEEWVSLVSYANVRAAPSTTAETLRVAGKGAVYRATGRSGNWVQITDPATSEVGWVYSRFIETAEAPAR